MKEIAHIKPLRHHACMYAASPVFSDSVGWFVPPEHAACDHPILLLYLERLTHPHSPSSDYILVNEADEGLGR